MANELQTVLPPILDSVIPHSQGNVSVEIKNFLAGNKIDNLHLSIPLSDVPPPLLTPDAQGINFNRDYYNLYRLGSRFGD